METLGSSGRGGRRQEKVLDAVSQVSSGLGSAVLGPPCLSPQTLVFSLVHLQVCRGGPILPATQGIHGNRAAERAGALPVQPQAEALLTEHVLWGQQRERV